MRDSNFFIAKKTTVQPVVFLIISWLSLRYGNITSFSVDGGAYCGQN